MVKLLDKIQDQLGDTSLLAEFSGVLKVTLKAFTAYELITPGEELGVTSNVDSPISVIGDSGYVRHNEYAKNTVK